MSQAHGSNGSLQPSVGRPAAHAPASELALRLGRQAIDGQLGAGEQGVRAHNPTHSPVQLGALQPAGPNGVAGLAGSARGEQRLVTDGSLKRSGAEDEPDGRPVKRGPGRPPKNSAVPKVGSSQCRALMREA